jgi:hypothetical protein
MASPKKARETWIGNQMLFKMGARGKSSVGTEKLSKRKIRMMGMANEKRTERL